MTAYAELQVTTNFSFLRGASHPEELAVRAADLGHAALAVTDRNSLAGVVRTHAAIRAVREKAQAAGALLPLRLIVGVRLDLQDGPSLLCYPIDRAAYGRLCQLLTLGKRRTGKGHCRLFLADLLAGDPFKKGAGQVLAVVPPDTLDDAFEDTLVKVKSEIKKNLYLIVNFLYFGDDKRRVSTLAELGERHAIPLVATNDVHAHDAARRPLQDVLTCIREGCTIDDAGFRLHANAERHLKPPGEMARLFAAYPEAIANTIHIARTCTFSLDELQYEYLCDPVPDGRTPQQELERLAWEGAAKRYPAGVPDKVTEQVAQELTLIGELKYAPYFLTIHDIVTFARDRGILCQGRGSAANSSVCYVLGITEVDPNETDLLFGRFISTEREEPPDIDVDFEHERREEVIQYIYRKYGRDHAGLTATVITYRSKSALRDVGKAMGLSDDTIQALQGSAWGQVWGKATPEEWARKEVERLQEAGIDPYDPTIRQVLALASQIRNFPRHLSQHTGGFVVTKMPLDTVVPIENAAMENRTVIEWDKDDLDTIGIFKIDVLALGMLTCIRKAFEFIERHHRRPLTLATVPPEDPETYDMLCAADTVGVFQVESRAQMNMLPRLKPRKFYDLVIEVAIVRPGPIQGGMVHPYLRRRDGLEPADLPSQELKAVLDKTKGVPLFQEQAMKIAMVAAGFSAAEADKLRRSMASFRRNGQIEQFRTKLIEGMVANNYERDFAERCFSQIEGFGEYGFPESHAASFAKLVYVSAWLKCHYPAAFAAALLNSQPMGFYAPAQIVRDARQHGVEVRPVDVNHSEWDCTLEPADTAAPASELPPIGTPAWRLAPDRSMALRLGFREIKGLAQGDADIIATRREQGYASLAELKARAQPKSRALETLARADAFASLRLDRRNALWAAKGLADAAPLPLFSALADDVMRPEPEVALPEISLGEQVADDYRMLKMSLKAHPMKLLRGPFDAEHALPCGALLACKDGAHVRVAGLVLTRQRPGEGNAIFITLEDETGIANLIVWPHRMERYRRVVLGASLMCAEGKLQREGIVTHLIADRLYDMSHRLGYLTNAARTDGLEPDARDPRARKPNLLPPSRDFH